jgi:predicted regulator of Ras-like GTPase activity (Roadblock/LC7/MglB family)
MAFGLKDLFVSMRVSGFPTKTLQVRHEAVTLWSMTDQEPMVTRQSELIKVLTAIQADLGNPVWVALVDDDGLMVASVPESPTQGSERIAAMTAAGVIPAKRVLEEVEGGSLRFVTFAGSRAQVLVVAVDQKRYLSIGLSPQVSVQSTFSPLSNRVPELLSVLKKRYSRR